MTTLRPALLSDIAALWALRTRAVRISCASHYTQPQIDAWADSPPPAAYPALLRAGGGVVAMAGEHIAGYAMLDADNWQVDAVFVDPGYAGMGLGKRLLAALEGLARERGMARLQLSASLNAVAFYQSAGFVPLRQEAHAHRSGVQLDSVVMEKRLA